VLNGLLLKPAARGHRQGGVHVRIER
jgi:hypothetical protein